MKDRRSIKGQAQHRSSSCCPARGPRDAGSDFGRVFLSSVSACWNNGEEGIDLLQENGSKGDGSEWPAGGGHLADTYILNPLLLEVGVIVTASFLQTKNSQPQRGQHLGVLDFKTRSLPFRSFPLGALPLGSSAC